MWDTAQRRAPQLPPAGEAPAAPVSGRRAAAPLQQPEPLTYSTQGRPAVPSYDGPFRNTVDPQGEQPDDLAPTQALPKQDQPTYRVRDFAPAASERQPEDLPPTQALPKQDQPTYRVRDYAPAAFAPAPTWTAEPAPLEYHTAARVPQPEAAPEPVAEAPTVHAVPDALVEPPSHTLTRRELRALQQQQGGAVEDLLAEPIAQPEAVQPEAVQAEAVQAEAVQAEVVQPEPTVAPEAPAQFMPATAIDATEEKPWPFAFGAPSAPEPEAVVEAELVQPEPGWMQVEAVQPEPVLHEPVQFQEPEPARLSAIQMPPVEPAPIDMPSPATPADGARALFGDIMTPIQQPLAPIAPEARPDSALDTAMAEYDALAARQEDPAAQVPPAFDAGAVPATPVPATPEPASARPFGHWSTQLELEDETQPYENTLTRRVGSGHAATNALVLPMTPERDIRGALTGTGEIMLTGSIDLPASLASTGTTDRHDHGGLDALFDTSEHELSPTDSQPVRAVRAVSTHATGQAVTHTQKPKGTKVLNVLLFSAVGMAVVGVGLLVTVVLMNVL